MNTYSDNDYEINEEGIIINHPLFDGSPSYLPHFYDLFVSGFGDVFTADHYEELNLDEIIVRFSITKSDREAFPNIPEHYEHIFILIDGYGIPILFNEGVDESVLDL